MSSNECNSTLDCLKVGSGVPRVCYEEVSFSEREFFCDCSNWYGWTGDNCDQPTFLTRYALCTLTFLGLWSIVIVLLSARTMFFHLKYCRSQKRAPNPVFFVGLLVFMGASFLLIYTGINIPAQIDSTRFDVFSYRGLGSEGFEDVAAKGGRAGTYCFIMLGNLYLLISAQVIISWYDVIEKTARFFPLVFNYSPNKILKALKIWMIFYLILSCSLLILDLNSGAKINLIIFALLAAILYSIGGNEFVKMLKVLSQEDNEVSSNASKIVIFSYRTNTILLLVEVVLMSLNAGLFLVFDQSLEPGSFNPIVIVRDLIGVCGLSMMTLNSWYVHQISQNVLKLDKTQGWLPSFVSNFGNTSFSKNRSRSDFHVTDTHASDNYLTLARQSSSETFAYNGSLEAIL